MWSWWLLSLVFSLLTMNWMQVFLKSPSAAFGPQVLQENPDQSHCGGVTSARIPATKKEISKVSRHPVTKIFGEHFATSGHQKYSVSTLRHPVTRNIWWALPASVTCVQMERIMWMRAHIKRKIFAASLTCIGCMKEKECRCWRETTN